MKSVTSKTSTLRRATATARVRANPPAISRMQANDLPKKDVLVVARVAGTAAAKKTWDLIPYCHPIPVGSVEIDFEVGEGHVDVTASVEAVWKTGVEMEALTAASVAALTIYDMLKAVEKDIEIERVRLQVKQGGKSEFTRRIPKGFKAAVIVTSDSTHAGNREDRSGKIACEKLRALGITPACEVLPDDRERIADRLRSLVADGMNLILTTGGTGLGPRDVTVEATRQVIDREIPGVAEAARAYGQERTPYAMLSRGVAGVCGKTVIVNLPGSSRGVEETMNAIFPGILHAYGMLQGEGHG
jgi:molybdenum cofactor biosynthesis protein MoaC